MAVKQTKAEIATQNVRIYPSTRKLLSDLARAQGKTIPRVIDEKFNPEKYAAKVQ